jgi:hypothetical protein
LKSRSKSTNILFIIIIIILKIICLALCPKYLLIICDRKLLVHYKLTTTTTANAQACPRYKMAMPCNWLSEMGLKIYIRSGYVDFPATTICQLYTKFLLPQLCITFDKYESPSTCWSVNIS